MKKFFMCVAILVLCSAGFCQSPSYSKEELRFACAEVMVSFSESVRPYFSEGMSLEEFQSVLLGKSVPTETGKDMIAAAFQILINKQDKEIILKTYAGKEVAKCIHVMEETKSKEGFSDGAGIFGLEANVEDMYAREGSCKWYQIGCHLKKLASWLEGLFVPGFIFYPVIM